MCTIFVDDTDLYVFDADLRDASEVYHEMQASLYLYAWGDLLIGTVGALKPEECFYNMVDYE